MSRVVRRRRLRRQQELRAGQGAGAVHAAGTGVLVECSHRRRRGPVREAGGRGRGGPAAAQAAAAQGGTTAQEEASAAAAAVAIRAAPARVPIASQAGRLCAQGRTAPNGHRRRRRRRRQRFRVSALTHNSYHPPRATLIPSNYLIPGSYTDVSFYCLVCSEVTSMYISMSIRITEKFSRLSSYQWCLIGNIFKGSQVPEYFLKIFIVFFFLVYR